MYERQHDLAGATT